MNLNDYIAEAVSLAEYCEDKETKDILLNHLKELLDLQLCEAKQTQEELNRTIETPDCKQCNFENGVKYTFKVNPANNIRRHAHKW